LLFCVLWLPFFYAFWSSVRPARTESAGQIAFFEKICAIALGTLTGIIRFFFVNFIKAYGFGASRILSAFFDYAAFPVFLPLIACFVFYKMMLKFFLTDYQPDWTGFVILASIPQVLSCAIRWSSNPDPVTLVLTPVLRTSFAVILCPVFRFMLKKTDTGPSRKSTARYLAGTLMIAGFLILITVIWWKFFSQENFTAGVLLLFLLAVKALVLVFLAKSRRRNPD